MVWFLFGDEFKISYTSQNEIQKGNVYDRFAFIAV